MDKVNLLIVGVILVLLISGGAAVYYYRKRNLEKFFNQIYEEMKQVPNQKKNSFLLLMFKESLSSTKNKSSNSKLQNRKYLDIQLIQMANILKDSSNVQDKLIKRSLNLLNDYQAWEKGKMAEDKKVAQDKAS